MHDQNNVFYAVALSIVILITWPYFFSRRRTPPTCFNLFGLIPYDPVSLPLLGGFLMIGAWPLVMGFAQWLQIRLTPASASCAGTASASNYGTSSGRRSQNAKQEISATTRPSRRSSSLFRAVAREGNGHSRTFRTTLPRARPASR